MTAKYDDQPYLQRQYHDASNLTVRIVLHERFSTNREPWPDWYFRHVRIPDEARILELGAGPGMLWRDLNTLPPGWEVTISDMSPGMVEEAQAALVRWGDHIRFAVVDAQAIPFPDDSFDVVMANFMLYHVPDRARAYAEIRRVLRPAGHFYAATNGRRHMIELKEAAQSAGTGSAPTLSFGLENGGEELSQVFAHVVLHLREDRLAVTEVEPVVAYARSGWLRLSPSDEEHLRATVAHAIATEGAFHITKASGVFESW